MSPTTEREAFRVDSASASNSTAQILLPYPHQSANSDPPPLRTAETAARRSSELDFPWFALQIRSRCENLSASILRNKGFDVFLPLYKSRRLWSDRSRDLMMPLLPGYVFCRFDRLEKSIPVVTTPGVVRVIGFGKIPEPVDQNEISALQRIIDSGLAAEPHPFLTAGDRVRIMHGPLTGVSGTLVKVKNRHRLVLSITLLQRSVSVEIDRHWIRPE